MLFNSHIFVFGLLPVSLLVWHLLNKIKKYNWASLFLIFTSLWFYGYAGYKGIIIPLISLFVNYFISFLLKKNVGGMAKAILICGILFNIGTLGYFKYCNFFIENLNAIFGSSYTLKTIVLPLGISFFTLSQVAFIVDRYRKEIGHPGIIAYANFVLFFPKLISGPIVYFSDFDKEFENDTNRKFDVDRFSLGFVRFIEGLAKKVLIANTLSYFVDYGMDRVYYLDTLSTWVWAIFYSLELYFDFSGYSDMAIGIGEMFGISIPENFNSPYKAASIKDFWKRWHISLTKFLTRYIYIPLGGNRKGYMRMMINTLVVFLVSGLWHGASWTFVIWGILHGIASIISGSIKKKNFITHAFTMIFVVFAWGIFRCENWNNMTVYLTHIFVPVYNGFIKEFATAATQMTELYVVVKVLERKAPQFIMPVYYLCTICVFFVSYLLIVGKNTKERIEEYAKQGISTIRLLGLSMVFAWCVISFSQVTTFLYFKF